MTAVLPPVRSAPLPPPLAGGAQLTDRGAVGLAAAVWIAALVHRPVPLVAALLAVALAVAVRRPAVVVMAAVLLASALAARSHAGLAPVAAGRVDGVVTLVADPAPTAFGWRADVRLGRKRVELRAHDSAGGALGRALTGERLRVAGRLAPPRPGSPWLVPRHVVGSLTATRVERVDGGAVPWRAANRFRRLLVEGSQVMAEGRRALYAGFVLGDDRDQPPEVVDDFRGAGLTHVLVVSGQNVAFVLVLVSPLTGRLRWGWRWAITLGVIAAFGTITRFEPSVLRASAMAAVAVTAGAVGRPTVPIRTLALGVAGLVLIDPLLVLATGFQLSVGASLAIALLAGRIAAVLPGPRLVAEAVAVGLAAQFGVAPVLVPLSGGLPVASLLANPLAVPVAGLVTTWGLPAGVVAGIGGPAIGAVVHAPTELLIGWVAGVAQMGAALPLGRLGWVHLAGLAVALVVGARPPPVRYLALAVAAVAAGAPAVALRSPPAQLVADGVAVHRAGGATVVVVDGARPIDVLETLRDGGVRRIDVLVATGRLAPEVARVLRHRWPVGRVIDPQVETVRLAVGGLEVRVEPPAPPVVVPLRPP